MKSLFVCVLAVALSACIGRNATNQTETCDANAAVEEAVTAVCAGWPDNEFGQLVPQPNAGTVSSSVVADMKIGAAEGAGCRIDISWTGDDRKAYAAQLREAGFTIGEFDESGEGDTYMVTANKEGALVTAMPQGIIIVRK